VAGSSAPAGRTAPPALLRLLDGQGGETRLMPRKKPEHPPVMRTDLLPGKEERPA